MNRTVLLFRHGKSDWNASYGRDHDRPLNNRGKRASRAMGNWLANTGPLPELILCSTAIRARSTCDIAREAGAWIASVQYERELYHAGPEVLLHYLQEVSDSIQTVMLVGHQPTWSMTATLLSGHPIDRFPTASMARVDLSVDSWAHTMSGTGKLVWHQLPKRLPDHYYSD